MGVKILFIVSRYLFRGTYSYKDRNKIYKIGAIALEILLAIVVVVA